MGVENKTDNGTDDGAENVEKPPTKDTSSQPPPDRPGSPGQPSRLENLKAAREGATEQREERDDKQPPPAGEKSGAGDTGKQPEGSWPRVDRPGSPGQPSRPESLHAAREGATEQRGERDGEQAPPAGERPEAETREKPGQAKTEAADRDTRSPETESDDRLRNGRSPAAAPVEDIERQTEKDRPAGQAGETEREADAPTAEDRPDSERPGRNAETGTEDESGDAPVVDDQPESEGKPEKPSGQDVWDEFASKSATYEMDGRQHGFRTWGDEFAARRASREAARQARENDSAQSQDESPIPEQPSAEGQKGVTDTRMGQSGGESLGTGDIADTDTKADGQDDPGTGVTDTDSEIPDQGDAWREHIDVMRAKWADFESEQTPDKPPEETDRGDGTQGEGTNEGTEDLSGDEPGSWRGEGDQYLAIEENYSVDRVFERIRDQETDVTQEVKTGEVEVADARLVGLEYRLKGEERFKEKAAEQLAAELREDPRRAAESIPDALRYTYQIPADKYVQGYRDITKKLADDGYEMVYSRNSWDTPVYKGVNTRWKNPSGQLFEVQFHTPESFEAKQLTHVAYERRRSPLVGDLEAEKLDEFQREVSAGIPIPKNVSDIPSFRRED